MKYTDQEIARICHEANRALQLIQGDLAPSPAWEDAEQWQVDSSIDSVAKVRAGATPEQLHQEWSDHKRRAGWVHGPVKDANAKTHPGLVPFAELDEGQRDKDIVFTVLVATLTG